MKPLCLLRVTCLLLACSLGLCLMTGRFAFAQAQDSFSARAEAVPAHAVRLETLALDRIVQGWGTPGRARSVDNNPLTLQGTAYRYGVGTHAESEILLDLKGAVRRFIADVGVDDEVNGKGSCTFEIYLDGKLAFESAVLRGGTGTLSIDLDLTGKRRMRLVVTDAGDGIDHDHADWAGAFLMMEPEATERPEIIAVAPELPPPIWRGPESPVPALHGPRIVGTTPGKPFLFRIPATGQRPLRFQASNIPAGLTLNESTGILYGVLTKPGTYTLEIRVTGSKGKASRKLVIVGGQQKLALTPPLGWNSWNVWGATVTAERIRQAADAFVQSGLADYGYAYINIDDGWEAGRDANGFIQANDKFPDMRALANYIHARGLKLGIYSSPGPKTCAGYEGSFLHEKQDAQTYAAWGVDYLKYDWCSYGSIAPSQTRGSHRFPFAIMKRALDEAPRDIIYSLCQYGMNDVWEWGATVNGNCWRTTGDITDTWASMSGIGFNQDRMAKWARPGRWNDPDMLVVGKVGWGPNVRQTNLTPNEQITHITLWSLLAAPLLIGCDLAQLDEFTRSLLTNTEVLEVDQDPLGISAIRLSRRNGVEVWARPLFDGTVAVGFFNRGAESMEGTVRWSELEPFLAASSLNPKNGLPVRDLWQRQDLGAHTDRLQTAVPAHGAVLVKIGKPRIREYIPTEPLHLK